ncbi:MAG: hypothetical protein LBS83_03665 [Holosporales bacterium]|jgi:hypothetical protein|nr:hypothetical protein [Holosporales bacterium]
MNINMKKFFKLGIFAAGLAAMFFVGDVNAAAPAAGVGHPESHLFAGAVIADEGFRWRNSFDFTVDLGNGGGQQTILPANWWFNDGTGVAPGFVPGGGGFIANATANGIHGHLSNIVNIGRNAAVAGPVLGQNHMAAAAITITVFTFNFSAFEGSAAQRPKIVKIN